MVWSPFAASSRSVTPFVLAAVLLICATLWAQAAYAASELATYLPKVAPAHMFAGADRFGAPSFGTVTGLTVPVVAALGVMSMRYAGEVYDRTGGYDLLFVTFAVLNIVAAGAIFATRFTRGRVALAIP